LLRLEKQDDQRPDHEAQDLELKRDRIEQKTR